MSEDSEGYFVRHVLPAFSSEHGARTTDPPSSTQSFDQRTLLFNLNDLVWSQEVYDRCKHLVLTAERALLQAIGFDLVVHHPHPLFLQYAKLVSRDCGIRDLGWDLLNDSFRTTLCLRFAPIQIAIAAVRAAADMIGASLDEPRFWRGLDILEPRTAADLNTIQGELLKVAATCCYTAPTQGSSRSSSGSHRCAQARSKC